MNTNYNHTGSPQPFLSSRDYPHADLYESFAQDPRHEERIISSTTTNSIYSLPSNAPAEEISTINH